MANEGSPDNRPDSGKAATHVLSKERAANLARISRIIQQRRSFKPDKLSDRPIDRSLIEQLFENANWAPTHGKTEPWRFRAYTGPARQRLADALQRIYKETTPEAKFRPDKYAKFGRNPQRVPVVLVISMERQKAEKIPEIEEIEAVACAVQNIHLSASAVGLGGFWSSPPHIYSEAMHKWLGLGPKDRCLGLFYLGWPLEDSWPEGRRRSIADKVEWFED